MLQPLVTNPGGTLDPDAVVGRDDLVARYWKTLEVQSLALLAPRRVGKTSICVRMVEKPPAGFVARLRDLEGRSRASDFVQLLFEDVSDLLSRHKRLAHRTHDLLAKLTGSVEIGAFKLTPAVRDWRLLLEAVFDDLEEHAKSVDSKVVLVWDEFTLFLDDVRRAGFAEEAMALLDLLRAARQRHRSLRMILTGSIGLTEVIDALRLQGYSNDPINDLRIEVVPFLAQPAARDLAHALLLGTGKATGDLPPLADHVASLCEGHPYLIHHLVDRMKYAAELTVPGAERQMQALLEAPIDPLHLGHYLERLEHYLGPEKAPLAKEALDLVAREDDGIEGSAIAKALPNANLEDLRRVLRTLCRNGYLDRSGNRYRFGLSYLRQYWLRERDL